MDTEPSIFTRIINREIPADIVYESENVIAILTIEPVHAGHTLVIPKEPFVNIHDSNETVMAEMMSVAKKIANALLAAGLADGINLVMNNGEAAGQEVFHAHLHVIPRRPDDNSLVTTHHDIYAPGEAAEVTRQIISRLA